MTEESTREADESGANSGGETPVATVLGRSLPSPRRTLEIVGFVLLVAIVGLFVAVAVPGLVGADHSYVVLSDSMSPAIDAGAVVFVTDVPPESVETGEVITYQRPDASSIVTHRVVEVVESDGQRQFRTKGDANEEPDPGLVGPGQVIGRVAFSIPLIGYAVSFAGTDLGLISLIAVPAGVLALLELRDLYTATTEDTETNAPDEGDPDSRGGSENQ